LQRDRFVVTPPDPGHRPGPEHDLIDELLLIIIPAQGENLLTIAGTQIFDNVFDRWAVNWLAKRFTHPIRQLVPSA
jgi:hypothetical protein